MSLFPTRLGGNAPGLPAGPLPIRPLPPSPPADLPGAAQALHARRALEGALEHGIALLEALGLPHLVPVDFRVLAAACPIWMGGRHG